MVKNVSEKVEATVDAYIVSAAAATDVTNNGNKRC